MNVQRWGTIPSHSLYIAIATIACFIGIRLFLDGQIILSEYFVPRLSIGLAIPLGFLLGIPAVLGLVVGAAISELYITQQLGIGSTILAVFFLSIIPAMWVQMSSGKHLTSSITTLKFVQFIKIGLFTILFTGAIMAWWFEIIGYMPFYVSFPSLFTQFSIPTIILTPLIFGVGIYLTNHISEGKIINSKIRSDGIRIQFFSWNGFFLIGWICISYIGSIGFHIREHIPHSTFELYDVSILYTLVHPDIFGQGGRRAQVALGAFMICLLFIHNLKIQPHYNDQ